METLSTVTIVCMWGALVFLAIAVTLQEIRIGKCENTCRLMARRLTRLSNAAETQHSARDGEIINKTNNHRENK